MSPLPSPTPVRNAIVRMIFSPIGLLCGFVVLLITTCPGARGEDSLGLFAGTDGLRSSVVDLSRLDVAPATSRPAAVLGRSARPDHAPVSLARSATPSERQLRVRGGAADDTGSTTGSPSVLPPLVNQLTSEAAQAPAVSIRPMTGPAVGIRSKLPGSGR